MKPRPTPRPRPWELHRDDFPEWPGGGGFVYRLSPSATSLNSTPIPSVTKSTRASTESNNDILDWECMKPTINMLYMQDNLKLKDVIEQMKSLHGFAATVKMYKTQFGKWGWYKYKTKALRSEQLPRPHTKSCQRGPSTIPTIAVQTFQAQTLVSYHRLEDEQSRGLHRSLVAIRAFLIGSSENNFRWRTTGKYELIEDLDSGLLPSLDSALVHLQLNDVKIGGELLRSFFLSIEQALLRVNDLTSFQELAILIPHLILRFSREDVLIIYVKFLEKLSRAKFPNHPLHSVFSSMRVMIQGDQAGHLRHYFLPASSVWTDTFRQLRGDEDASTLAAWHDFFWVAAKVEPSKFHPLEATYTTLVGQARREHGDDNTYSSRLEMKRLIFQWQFSRFMPDFEEAVCYLLKLVQSKYLFGSVEVPKWAYEDRYTYTFCFHLLSDFFSWRGQLERAIEARRKSLLDPMSSWYTVRAVGLKLLLLQAGRTEEAQGLGISLSPAILESCSAEKRQVL